MYLIVGLGNPDSVYKNTFHNVGFMAVDRFAEKIGAEFTKKECKAVTAHTFVGGSKVIIAKPQTYMNLSGESVLSLTAKYKIEQDAFFIVYDDVDLGLGALRVRESGSAGTHNGMRSIVAALGRQDFPRLRVGVGAKPEGWDLANWVLSHYQTEEERKVQFDAFLRAADAALVFAREGIEPAMRACNVKG